MTASAGRVCRVECKPELVCFCWMASTSMTGQVPSGRDRCTNVTNCIGRTSPVLRRPPHRAAGFAPSETPRQVSNCTHRHVKAIVCMWTFLPISPTWQLIPQTFGNKISEEYSTGGGGACAPPSAGGAECVYVGWGAMSSRAAQLMSRLSDSSDEDLPFTTEAILLVAYGDCHK
jgi:hypothetical protein